MQRRRKPIIAIALLCLPALSACEQLGLDDGKAVEAEGKAVGAACRHAGRALEDCYQINSKVPKAAVFAGWKEMNDYMTEQKLEVIKPTLPPPLPKSKKKVSMGSEPDGTDSDGDASHETDASAPAQTTADDEKKTEVSNKGSTEKAIEKHDAKSQKRKPAATN